MNRFKNVKIQYALADTVQMCTQASISSSIKLTPAKRLHKKYTPLRCMLIVAIFLRICNNDDNNNNNTTPSKILHCNPFLARDSIYAML